MRSTVLFFLSFLPLAASAEAPAKAKVGVILSETGDARSIGDTVRNGITLGFEKLPPSVQSSIELVFENDGSQPAQAVTALRKLLQDNELTAVLTCASGICKAVSPILEQHKIPLLCIGSDPEIVANRNYSVLFWVTPEEEARVTVNEALRRGYKSIARITSLQAGLQSQRAAFDRESAGRFHVVLDEEYPVEVKDFRSFLTKLRSRKETDAIMVLLMTGQSGLFAKQARELQVNLPLFAMEIFEDAQEVKASDGALIGHWYVNADDPGAAYFAEYGKRFPGASFFGAGNAHDAMLILGTAIAKDSSREAVNHFLHNVKEFEGVMGKYSSSGDNRFTLPAVVKIVTAGGFEKLNRP